jgi:hypothetical protein
MEMMPFRASFRPSTGEMRAVVLLLFEVTMCTLYSGCDKRS